MAPVKAPVHTNLHLGGWLWWLAMLLSPFSRIYVHDALSGTRLIKSERVLARIAA
ncbi:MAG: hypothetical protein ACYCX6_08075 [Vulcanimicrobiaceae bacterium]